VFPRHIEGRTPADSRIEAVRQSGIETLTGGIVARVFFVRGNLTLEEVERLSARLLADPVTEGFKISPVDSLENHPGFDHCIDVTLLPGVTDPVAENLVSAARLMGLAALTMRRRASAIC
jgi:hypothetical protein